MPWYTDRVALVAQRHRTGNGVIATQRGAAAVALTGLCHDFLLGHDQNGQQTQRYKRANEPDPDLQRLIQAFLDADHLRLTQALAFMGRPSDAFMQAAPFF
jgi:hypothetical protein